MSAPTQSMAHSLPRGGFTALRAGGVTGLLRQGSLTLLDQMVASGTTFLTGVLVGRVCAKEDFGFYMLGFSLFTFLLTLQGSLVSTPFMIYYPRVKERAATVLVGSSLLQQSALAVFAALAVGGGSLVAGLYLAEPRLAWLLAALSASLLFLLLRDFIRQICFVRFDTAAVLAFDVFIAVAQLLALAGLAWAGLLNGASAYLALGLVCALGAGGWLWTQRNTYSLNPRAALVHFQEHWHTARWLFASGLLWSLSMNLYAWLLAGFHGAASAGAWAAALGVVTLLNPVTIGVQNFLAPRIMRAYAGRDVNELHRVVGWSSLGYAGSLALFSLFLLFAGNMLVVFIYGAKYDGNGLVAAVLAFNFALNAFGFTLSRGLFALEKAKIDFQVNLAALASLLLVGLWLAQHYGPLGAALGQVCTNAIASSIRGAAYLVCSRNAGKEVMA